MYEGLRQNRGYHMPSNVSCPFETEKKLLGKHEYGIPIRLYFLRFTLLAMHNYIGVVGQE